MKPQEMIKPEDLVCMDDTNLYRVELAYAREDNHLFGERIYRPDAQLWLHRDLAQIVNKAAKMALSDEFRFVLYDGLRTTDAQERMLQTQAVKENPQWLEEPRLLSPPGAGAHPRAMAIDCSLEMLDGELVDMGTAFDDLSQDAHRKTPIAQDNRKRLEDYMMNAAHDLHLPLLPLPQEWWDFRMPREVYECYAPLSDSDLPPDMRLYN